MKRPPVLYALKRSFEILSESPHKLLFILNPYAAMVKFKSLRTEGQRKALTKGEYIALKNRQSKEFISDKWSKDASGFARKSYVSYDEYLTHQKEKLNDIGGEAFTNRKRALLRFRNRFVDAGLSPKSSVLCLAARRGEEVEAFRSLGHFAFGIDLNPGIDNKYVVTGDFHNLDYPDVCVDCVYTNCLDHSFDIDLILKEVSRVLKPGGLFLVDVLYGYEEGYTVGDHDTMHWPTALEFANYLCRNDVFKLHTFRDLKDFDSKDWHQALLKKIL